MGLLIELYNIFIKPEAYGAILLMLIWYSYPKIKTFNKLLGEYEKQVEILSNVKTLLEKIDNGNTQMHEATYRNIRDYTSEIKLLLKDVHNDISKHDLSAKPNFSNITNQLDNLTNELPTLNNKLEDQSKIVEHLNKLSTNVEKVDHLLSVLFNQINNNTLLNRVEAKSISSSNDMTEIKF